MAVATSDAQRLEAWVGYLTLTAPFDGVIVARNANTFDFVLPSTGDPTAMQRAPRPVARAAAPIYVVDRTDIVRVFVDIPEQDANYVQIGRRRACLPGPSATNRSRAASRVLPGPSTSRAAPSVRRSTCTTLAAGSARDVRLCQGNHRASRRQGTAHLALTHTGDQTFCWMYENGHAKRTEVQTGVNDGKWIEVTNLQRPGAAEADEAWEPISGKEQVILGDLSILADGDPVEAESGPDEAKVAAEHALGGRPPT